MAKLALVGCGGIAAAHALAIQNLGQKCQIVALVDTQFEIAESFKQKFALGALIFTQIKTMLEDVKPDAVIICTPPATHVSLASQSLNHDVAVLCEKPLCLEIESARQLCELARTRGLVLRTSAKYRFVEGILEAKRCLNGRCLGDVHHVEIAFGSVAMPQDGWRSDAAQSGGGVLMDNGPHAVDLARFLLGEVRLAGVNLRGGNRPRVEEEASLRLENQAGVPISIELSWRRSLSQTFLQISGEEGILSVRWDGIFWQHGGDEEQIPNSRYDKNRAFARQLEMFLNDISAEIPLHNEAPWQDEDGLRAVEIIVAAYEMAKSERSQSVL